MTTPETPPGMVRIPTSEFLQGTPESVLDWLEHAQSYPRTWFEDETPQRVQRVDSFCIDRFPVTNERFRDFVDASGYSSAAERRGFGLVYTGDYWEEVEDANWASPAGAGSHVEDRLDHPVVHMAHEDAQAFAQWAERRLPTEAEWELAARGVEFRIWPWGDAWEPRLANTPERLAGRGLLDLDAWKSWWPEHAREAGGMPGTTAVGVFGASGESPFGVADAAGNVLEWTASTYEPYDRDRTYDDVFSMAFDRYAVMRGGSWMHLRWQVRCSERIAADPHGYSSFATGFRCAL